MNIKIKHFALIIGSMKCGTSSLYKYLAEHPEISACKDKEPGFFHSKRRFDRGLLYYQSLYDWNPNIHKIALEASTTYTSIFPENLQFANIIAAKNIAQVQADANIKFKFIYILRNPIERIESHYNHIQAMPGRSKMLKSLGKNLSEYMINTSKYAMQIEEFYKRFDSKDILLLDFEQLKNEPDNLIKSVCNFLEVNPEYKFKKLNIKHNHHTEKRSIVLPGYYLIRRTEFMKSKVSIIPEEVKNSFRSFFGSKVKHEYFKLSTEEKKHIMKELQYDLIKLNSEYGFDTSQWNIES